MTRLTKPALTAQGQLELLIERGLQEQDADRALRLLEVTTLFRLTPYMRPFQHPEDSNHHFRPGSRLADMVRIYRFDSDLRQLMMMALERVEVAVRECRTCRDVSRPWRGSGSVYRSPGTALNRDKACETNWLRDHHGT